MLYPGSVVAIICICIIASTNARIANFKKSQAIDLKQSKASGSIPIAVQEGGSFVHYIDIDDGKLQKCVLQIPNENISLYPNQLQSAKNPVKNKITSFESRACGFKLNNFEAQDPRKYNLTATIIKDGKQISVNETLEVNIQTKSKIDNATLLVSYGEKYYLGDCVAGNQRVSCSLFAPNGKLIIDSNASCGYNINHLTKEDLGDWRCEVNLRGEVEPYVSYIKVQLLKQFQVDSWYKKQDGYGIVGCQYVFGDKDKVKPLTSCNMISPQDRSLNIETYLGTGRYDSLGTNFTKNICQFEFKLPALQNETGTWTCDLDGNRDYITVEEASAYEKSSKLKAKLGDKDVRIHCEVPYSASSGFLVNPSGIVSYKAKYNEAQNGEFEFNIKSLIESDFGQWSCHFAKENTYEDDIVTVEVERFNTLEANVKQVEVVEGDKLVVLFKAEGALSYCVIVDPQGNTFHIQPNTKSAYLEYYGAGFDHGECGIQLKGVSQMHEGVWKCLTNTVDISEGDQQATASTQVNVSRRDALGLTNASSASSANILIGVMFAVMLAMAVVVYFKFLKEKRERDRVSPPNEDGDENSGTSFVLHHL